MDERKDTTNKWVRWFILHLIFQEHYKYHEGLRCENRHNIYIHIYAVNPGRLTFDFLGFTLSWFFVSACILLGSARRKNNNKKNKEFKRKIKVIKVPICFSMYAASSGVALGITPGSLKLVRRREDMTKMNNRPPITGIAGVNLTAKNGQLKLREKLIKKNPKYFNIILNKKGIITVKKTKKLKRYVLTILRHNNF